MKKQILCLVISCAMLTACGGSTSAVSSTASAAAEQASGAANGTTESEAQNSQTEAASSTGVIYLKETATDYDKDGNLIETTTYSYNDHNDVSEYVFTFPDDDPVRYYYEYDYRDDGTISSCRRYNSKDHLLSETFYTEDGETIDHVVQNTYSSQHEDDSDEDAEDWIRIQTILNSDEAPVLRTIYSEDGSVRSEEKIEYDDYGNSILFTNNSYKDGAISRTTETSNEYEYNSDGTIAKNHVVMKATDAPDSVYTDEYTYQDGYLYKVYSSGTTDDYSWWLEFVYNEEGLPVSWSSDDMEEYDEDYSIGEEMAGLVTYRSDGTVDIQVEDGFVAFTDGAGGDIEFAEIGSRQDIKEDPEEELDENGNVAARTYYCHNGDVNKRVEYTYITVEN